MANMNPMPGMQLRKLGKREPQERWPNGYEGGYAFQTVEDAQRRIDEAYPESGYAVFGLDTTWENTYPASDGWWCLLIEDAPIIVLPSCGDGGR